jgi:hypothetical protein
MKNLILLFVLSCIGLTLRAQHYLEWSFVYTFHIENERVSHNKLDSFEVFVNEPFQSRKFKNGNLSFSDSTIAHSVQLNYGCISCGFGDLHFPPTLILKLYITDSSLNDNHRYSMLIPISFDEITKPDYSGGISSYDFGSLKSDDFNSWYERLAGIHVKKDGSIIHYKKGEYDFPTTDKLIKI